MYKILVLNPGSTSTKIAVCEDNEIVYDETIRHSVEDLHRFNSIPEQKEYRYQVIEKLLNDNGYKYDDFDAYACRGGIIKPMASGTYEVNEKMVNDLKTMESAAMHASCLAGLIGNDLEEKYHIPAYVVDPVVVDELQDIARVSGVAEIERTSTWHALNQKAIARIAAKDLNKTYETANLIVAHMGGGVSVAAHHNGKTIDCNNAILGEGPMSPERCGALPAMGVAQLIYDFNKNEQDIKDYCSKNGGMVSYLGINDMRDCEKLVKEGNKKAILFYQAMAYQIAKEIGAMAAVLKGKVDAIVLTGGIAYSDDFTKLITEYVNFIAPVKKYPGEDEVSALAQGVLRVLNKEIEPKIYQ
ncbi:MAG: butyrate kinase [Bacilli bacterium]|jgi:butyrate kinase|nr:butyrate kinase [Bacilli bacterium]